MADSPTTSGFTLPQRPTSTSDTPFTTGIPGQYGSLFQQIQDALGISSGHGMYNNDRYSNILNNLGNMRGWGYALPGGGLLNIAHDASTRQPGNQPMFPQSGQGQPQQPIPQQPIPQQPMQQQATQATAPGGLPSVPTGTSQYQMALGQMLGLLKR
jgi:hypothetical protein